MTIGLRHLSALDDLAAVESFQRGFLGDHATRSICTLPVLRSIVESGGIVLGAWDSEIPGDLPAGCLVDLSGSHEGFSAFFSILAAVLPEHRNRGIGFELRGAERARAQERGIEVVRWWVDPLRGDEAHMALNKLGAVGVSYERNVFGELPDRSNAGLATDRFLVEWWIESPRSSSIVDDGRLAAHYRLGFHEMTVVTKTTPSATGQRALLGFDSSTDTRYVLAEIPVHLDAMRDSDPIEARKWRLATRDLFENLFSRGYLLVGLVHEAGRSFQLFEAAGRGEILGRA
jgi:predicted GNAT superfamily acetyltransferase